MKTALFTVAAFFISVAAQAGTLIYDCSVTSGPGTEQTLEINQKVVNLTSPNPVDGMTFSATLDNT